MDLPGDDLRYNQGPPNDATRGSRSSCNRVENPIWAPLTESTRHIRLLQMLEKGDHDRDSLQSRLTVHSIDEVAEYNAVSYTWGQRELVEKVLINGDTYMVTTNCHQALTQVYR